MVFEKIKEFVSDTFKKSDNSSKIVNLVDVFIRNNFDTPDSLKQIPGLDKRVWALGQFTIRHDRQLRGDLISVEVDGREVVGYVDQTHAYKGLMGINDILVDQSDQNVINNLTTTLVNAGKEPSKARGLKLS